MNIAHILPYSVIFPLKAHNARHHWALQLATSQARSGHDVTIYCNPSSRAKEVTVSGIHYSTNKKIVNNIETFRLALSNDHDIYHSHLDELHYNLAHETTKPIVYTQHWWPRDSTVQLAKKTAAGNLWAVPPTRYMYNFDMLSGIQTKGFIYHGINLEVFHNENVQKTNRLLFVGRISPEKNLNDALSISKKSDYGLDIIGKITAKNQQYWEGLRTQIDGEKIQYLGVKNPQELRRYYSTARALLFPSDIHEAFGLVAIESQACGTPVIMKWGGSRGELIENGKTGFLCKSEDDFIAATQNVDTLNASECIDFAKQFDIRTMTMGYENLYTSLIAH